MNFKEVIVSGLVLLVIDLVWLQMFMGKRFGAMVQLIQGSQMKVRAGSAVMAYILLIVGVVMFGVRNVDPRRPLYTSILYGGLWGLVTYGVFDFTNMAIFSDYDLGVALMDTLWGGILGFLVTYLSYLVISRL